MLPADAAAEPPPEYADRMPDGRRRPIEALDVREEFVRNPPPDAGSGGVDERALEIYLNQIRAISDERGIPGVLRTIISYVLGEYPPPAGSPDALHVEAQRYARAREGAIAARATVIEAQRKLLDGWIGAAGDRIQPKIDENVHKIGMLIDNYEVGHSVLESYAAAVHTAQRGDADGRALLNEALTALAPLPDDGSLEDPQVRAIFPRARELAMNGCIGMLAAVGSLAAVTGAAGYRLKTQMGRSVSILGGAMPDLANLGPFDPPPVVGEPHGEANGTPAAVSAPGDGHSPVTPDDRSLPVTVPPAYGLPSTLRAKSVPGNPVSGSRRDPDDKTRTPKVSAPDQPAAVSIGPVVDTPALVPAPSAGPAPVTPRPERDASTGSDAH